MEQIRELEIAKGEQIFYPSSLNLREHKFLLYPAKLEDDWFTLSFAKGSDT
jgi:hypothetical protein